MMHAIEGMPFSLVLCGVIWALALGFAVGNYACSLVHRLPRGKLILDKTPYCGTCNASLQVKDLFPVFSALLLRHRCRYCGTPFPVSHTWTEILVGLLFVLAFFQYNFGEHYILLVSIGVFLITLAAIEANEGIVMGKVLICVMITAMILRTLVDGTIYNAFNGALYSLILGALLWRKTIRKVGHIYVLPTQAQLLVAGGLCVGASGLPAFYALFLALFLADWLTRKLTRAVKGLPITVLFGFSVMVPVMYPKLVGQFLF